MKRFLAAIALLWLFVAPSQAQQTKSQIASSIQTCFPDNSVGAITPAIVRSCLQNFASSWQQFAGINTQTGLTYTIQQSDYGQLVTLSNAGNITVTLPQAIGSFSTFNTYVANGGSTTVTVSPVTSLINGGSTFLLSPGQTAWIVSDGTNYHAVPFSQPPSGTFIPVSPVTASTLQTAINQATAAGCGTVVIPGGNWSISTSGGSITISSGCVTIQGSGGASAGGVTGGTVLTTTSAANDLFSVTSTGFVRFTSFSIASSVTRNAGTSGITFNESSLCQGTSRKIVDHMSIDAQSIHINIQSACHATIFDNYLTSATQTYIVYTQPDTADAGDNVIAFNEMWDVLGTAGATEGVLWKAGSGLRIIGNRFLGSYGTGLHILFSKTSGNDGAMLVSDNTFEVQTSYGIHLECSAGASGAGTKIGQMIFHNNFVQSIEPGLNAGFAIDVCGGSAWVQGGEFSGNTIQSSVTAGFNAIIRNDGGDQFQITNNVVYSTGGANSGIRVTGNSTNTLVANNTLTGVAVANRYALNSSTWVTDNLGLTVAALPTAANGSTVYTTDGCATNPITGGCSGAMAIRVNGVWVATGVVKPMTQQLLTSGTNATYTTPSSPTPSIIKTTCWGSGAGGGGSAGATTGGGTGGAGNPTCFGTNATACTSPLVRANGGVAGQGGGQSGSLANPAAGGAGGSGGTGDDGFNGFPGGSSFATPAGNGNSGANGGGPGGGAGGFGAAGSAGTKPGGGGGGAGSQGAGLSGGAGAGSGEMRWKLITAPAASYFYTIGAGGTAGSAGTGGTLGFVGGVGGSGYCTVDEFYQ